MHFKSSVFLSLALASATEAFAPIKPLTAAVHRQQQSKPDNATSLFAKNILVSFDGTGDNALDFDPSKNRTITNVLKMHLYAGGEVNGKDNNQWDDQICLYEPGVGGKTKNPYLRSFRMAFGSLWRQTSPMKKRLEKIYEPGDKIYVTGFSRGAAAARKFCSDIYLRGLKLQDGERMREIPIEFLGCFDTVSMQVWRNLPYILKTTTMKDITSSKVLREKGIVAPNVKTAVHNVAMDDNRMWTFPVSFNPILLGHEDPEDLAKEGKVRHEAWFAGAHGDVGGNFIIKGMSDYSLQYMMEWMEKSGMKFLKPDEVCPTRLAVDNRPDIKFTTRELCIASNPTDPINLCEADKNLPTEDFEPSYRPVYVAKNNKIFEGGQVKIHESVLHHFEKMHEKGTPYPINPHLKTANFVVVGSLGQEMETETEKLASLL